MLDALKFDVADYDIILYFATNKWGFVAYCIFCYIGMLQMLQTFVLHIIIFYIFSKNVANDVAFLKMLHT
jgi:hypothetical protein